MRRIYHHFIRLLRSAWFYSYRYQRLLKIESEREVHNVANLAKLDQLRLLRDLLFDALRPFFMFVVFLLVVLITFFCRMRVGETQVSIDLYVSEFGFQLSDSLKLQFLENPIKIDKSLSLGNCGIFGTDITNGNFTIKPDDGTSINISELDLPRGTNVKLEQPLQGSVNLTAQNADSLSVDAEILRGNATAADVILEKDSLVLHLQESKSLSGNAFIVMKNLNDPTVFKASMDGLSAFQLGGFTANEFEFARLDDRTKQKTPTLIRGVIRLRETRSDTIALSDGDPLNLHFSQPVRVKVSSEKDGLRIVLSGVADDLSNNGESFMPRWYAVTFWSSDLFWTFMVGVIPVLLTYLFRQRRN